MSKRISFVNISNQWKSERHLLMPIIERILSKGKYVGGEEVYEFEKKIAKICRVNYAVGLNSGTDALTMALTLCGIRQGDEVITTPNSYIATASTIINLGAKPVFVDVLPDLNMDPIKLKRVINSRTKAIMPVHLAGRVCDMEAICKIAKNNNLIVIEDAAQAIGSKFKGKMSGSFGKAGCFSAHPLKNLNACGDAGYLTTNDKKIYQRAIRLRDHGHINRDTVKEFGYVSRLDNLQAAILNFRLTKLKQIIEKRRKNAKIYLNGINRDKVFISDEKESEYNTYHLFVIQTPLRNKLKRFLEQNQIESRIHYPIPIHLQPAAKFLKYKKGDFPIAEKQANEILSLPIYQSLLKSNLKKIINLINHFQEKYK